MKTIQIEASGNPAEVVGAVDGCPQPHAFSSPVFSEIQLGDRLHYFAIGTRMKANAIAHSRDCEVALSMTLRIETESRGRFTGAHPKRPNRKTGDSRVEETFWPSGLLRHRFS
jgi:hypothetical protein